MSGMIPHLPSSTDQRESGVAKRKSAASAICSPPPRQWPCTAAITGTGTRRQAQHASWKVLVPRSGRGTKAAAIRAGWPQHRREVQAGAEGVALAGDHDRAQAPVAAQPGGGGDQVVEDVQRQRVELVGPVEPDLRDAVRHGAGHVAGVRAHGGSLGGGPPRGGVAPARQGGAMKRLSDVKRIGYGAMRLSGPDIMGPPADPDEARRVLQRAIELGVDHIDTSDYYGPYLVNDLIREALAPYPPELVLVTKVGARRTDAGDWLPWFEPDDIKEAVHDNLGRLAVERLGGVNLRRMDGFEGSMAAQWTVLADLQSQGLIADLGLSNVTRGRGRGAAADRAGRLRAERLQPRPARRRRPHRRARRAGHLLRPVLPARRVQPAGDRGGRRRRRQARRDARCRWRWPGCCSARPTSC